MRIPFRLSVIVSVGVCFCLASSAHALTRDEKIKLEAEYILQCQYLNPSSAAHGAINNVYGSPTWVVPRENALAILGLIEASRVLKDPKYRQQAELAADYLVRVQDASDGAWYDQYNLAAPDPQNGLSKSPTQTAETMMALHALGYRSNRYTAMKRGAQFLMACQNPFNKAGTDDGLIAGGKDALKNWQTWRWTSDNAFGYQALRAAESWAMAAGDAAFAGECRTAAERVLAGINAKLYVTSSGDPDAGVWRRAVDRYDVPQEATRHEWINYAPQMLDVPAQGVGAAAVGEWIHRVLQQSDGALVWDDTYFTARRSPGFSFQAALTWLDLGQSAYANTAVAWAEGSGLWQTTPDQRGIAGGWIDWIENGTTAPFWQRFIDTSFYTIATALGRYDFRIATDFPVPVHPSAAALADLDGDGRKDILMAHELAWEVNAFRPNGLPVPGWPAKTCGVETVQSSWAPPAVADIDNDGLDEVVAAIGTGSGKVGVCVWENTGTFKWWRPIPNTGVGTVAIANLDNAGRPEIVFAGDVIAVLNSAGAIQPGWPKYSVEFHGYVAVADLNEDGPKDIVFSAGGKVWAVDRLGNVLPGWPVTINGRGQSPAMADVNGDGHLEVVASDVYGWVYVWDRRGNLLPGWPQRVSVVTPMGCTAPVLADIDDDPQAEIIVGTASNGVPPNNSNLFIFNGDGSGIAQVGLGEYDPDAAPIAVNLDAQKSANEIIAVNQGGTIVLWPPRATWPKQYPWPGVTKSPVVGDVNGDGLLELVVGAADTYATFLTDAPASAPQSQAWPTARADNARTGALPVILPKNEPPVLASIGNKTVDAGKTLTIQLSATDPEKKPLTYSVDTHPATSTWDPVKGLFVWTPDFGETGPFQYTFGVSDGVLADYETIEIMVNPVALTLAAVSDAPDPFSPNADAVKDTTTIKGTFNHMCGWSIDIKDAAGTVVRSFGGGTSSIAQMWDGKNSAGAVVASGVYTYTISGTDSGLSTVTASGRVTVDTVRPVLSALADSPDPFKPGTGQKSTMSFTLSEASTVTLRVYNASGTLVRTLFNNASAVAGVNSVIWDGKSDAGVLVAAGTYTYKVWVTDRAGTRAATYPYVATSTVQ